MRLARWRPVRDWLVRSTENSAPGVWAGIACRKRCIDDKFAEAILAGVDSIVILGAGLDTRGYQPMVPSGVRVFEVDLPENIADKRKRIPETGTVTLVPVDSDTEDLSR
ncbi:class I SAM-dependent methyltransferase [Kibdelosporangium philippinense]|uniref:Class I SAM-dependent methyltransferase n=1 Tax=Kibdelosporangium philippinense TaxID=211113 RepID=A0ABS8ZIU0_9PSEU|nr:class I SAM-dependent methyltransferase [Kibdelosporangium philippinense]